MDLRPGDEVLAPWLNDGFVYPAVLVAVEGAVAHVAYLDGDEADVPLAQLSQGMFGPGLEVQVNWKGRRAYYRGTIQRRLGMAVFMHYEDGSREWATIAQCRVPTGIAQSQREQTPNVLACPFCGGTIQSTAARCGTCGAVRPGRA